nr:MAG TPA: hypothetical protein [Caudoviricetes sp.]
MSSAVYRFTSVSEGRVSSFRIIRTMPRSLRSIALMPFSLNTTLMDGIFIFRCLLSPVPLMQYLHQFSGFRFIGGIIILEGQRHPSTVIILSNEFFAHREDSKKPVLDGNSVTEQVFSSGQHFIDRCAGRLFLRYIGNVNIRIPVYFFIALWRSYGHGLQEKCRRPESFFHFLQVHGIRELFFQFLLYSLQDIDVVNHRPPAFLISFFVSFSRPGCKSWDSNSFTAFSV